MESTETVINHVYDASQSDVPKSMAEDNLQMKKAKIEDDEEDDDLDVSDFHELLNKCESERQQHKLSEKWFSWRQFYFFTLPISLLTMSSGILAFLSTSKMFSSNTQETFGTIVGCMALVQIFWQTLSGKLNYETKAAMHLSASIDLKRLSDDLDFQQVEEAQQTKKIKELKKINKIRELEGKPPLSLDSSDDPAALESGTNQSEGQQSPGNKDINYYRAQYHQCMAGCKSVVPLCISQAFAVMDTHLALKLTKRSRRTLEHDMGKQGFSILYAAVTNDIYIGISHSMFWPLFIRSPTHVVKSAIDNLEVSYNPAKDFFARSPDIIEKRRGFCC